MTSENKLSEDNAYCEGIPVSGAQRQRLRQIASDHIVAEKLVPPVPLDSLKLSAATVLKQAELSEDYLPFTIVLLNNALWRDRLLKIPFDKRLLLLPQCLKHSADCSAEIDTLGLMCKHCGRCVIDRLSQRAEELGYAVLVAEGSPVVMAMIESGQIQATIGVSCLSVLERVFPYMEAAAVPGIAIPLLKDGCKDTVFEEDWLMEVLDVFEDDAQSPMDLTRLKHTVQDWFEPEVLSDYFGDQDGQAAQLALEWMSQEGKRYRPMLAAGVYATLKSTVAESIPTTVRQAAIAVECFHKASLVHDDIEDGDQKRYDRQTLHVQYGVPVALNVGDYLIGLGYELLANLNCSDAQKAKILQVASEGHRQLCRGQGAELESMRAQEVLSEEEMIKIFAEKTSPAFAVALKVGAILAQADATLLEALDAYSQTLGIAYQIRDDLHDRQAGELTKLFSIIASIAADSDEDTAVKRARTLLEDYRRRAVESLDAVQQSDCKAFLRKVITKLFDGSERMGCCDEHSPESD